MDLDAELHQGNETKGLKLYTAMYPTRETVVGNV